MNSDEEKTWRSIQRKEQEAFDNFYRTNYKYFFLAAFNYLKDAGLAEEVVNDVFVRLWENAHTIGIESSLKAYIYRAVINRSLDALDKHQRRRRRQEAFSRLPEATVELKEMEACELKVRLYKAIDELPEQCRKVFRMSRFEELKQQEIADRLGISIKTVKNHITHALKQLNKVVTDWNSLPLWIMVVSNFFGL
jgi:RNA polymerase sigma-70 factor (family 1)